MSKPLIALWCHPRSRSTALERAMIERGDLHVVHEPFSYLYYVHRRRASTPHLEEDASQPRSYAEIRSHLLAESAKRAVLFKDMAYHCLREITEDQEFLVRMRHVFLIRDPAQAIASHYAVDQQCTLEEIGIEQLCTLFRRVAELIGQAPPVVTAEALVADPKRVIAWFGDAAGLAEIEAPVRWQPGHRAEWDSWKEWHRDAASSTGIHRKSTEYETTVLNHDRLGKYYRHHLPFYEELRRAAFDGDS